ncbi:hypothetical protein [Nannocystis pusilla]|uniref:hypothetical protein n=1 Tax=Nannocystis pusilla TaxID=889268 RepID=UPI003DA343F2
MSADVSYLLLGFTTLMLLGFGLQIAIMRKRRGEYIVYKPLLLLALVVLLGPQPGLRRDRQEHLRAHRRRDRVAPPGRRRPPGR